jgi:dolichol-phosphate mannosyltransferase
MTIKKKLISIAIPCYNEEDNIPELYKRLSEIFTLVESYDFEVVFIDNDSSDKTVQILKDIASKDPRIKIIINTRNFGQICSPYWGLMQTTGDASILMVSDLQEPPEMIPLFIEEWEKGWKVVMAVKPTSKTNGLLHILRRTYYRLLNAISSVRLVSDTTGFGLYDRQIISHLKKIDDPYPYLRGLICELGYPIKQLSFNQPQRIRGISKNNFYLLFDYAMLGIISHSLVPIRLATIFGFVTAIASVVIAIYYTVMKLIYWYTFPIGMAPLVVGFFFFNGLLFIFIGLLGEYVGSIHTYVKNRPIVIEKERINFD